jgi:hypothetical protein
MPAMLPDCRWISPCHVLPLLVRVIPRGTPHSVLSGMVPDFLPRPLFHCEHERAGKSREIGRFDWDVDGGERERFCRGRTCGPAEGAERPETNSQRKRRATAPSSSRNERARSRVVAQASGCDYGAEHALVPAGSVAEMHIKRLIPGRLVDTS